MTQSKSNGSGRKPVVRFIHGELDTGVLALLRLTWFERGRPSTVEEFVVSEFEGGPTVVLAAIEQAEEQGFDLTVMSERDDTFGDC